MSAEMSNRKAIPQRAHPFNFIAVVDDLLVPPANFGTVVNDLRILFAKIQLKMEDVCKWAIGSSNN